MSPATRVIGVSLKFQNEHSGVIKWNKILSLKFVILQITTLRNWKIVYNLIISDVSYIIQVFFTLKNIRFFLSWKTTWAIIGLGNLKLHGLDKRMSKANSVEQSQVLNRGFVSFVMWHDNHYTMDTLQLTQFAPYTKLFQTIILPKLVLVNNLPYIASLVVQTPQPMT